MCVHSSNPAPSTGSVKPPAAPAPAARSGCGALIEGLAAETRLHPYDLILAIASLMGNVAGPQAMVITEAGVQTRPGFSMLMVDDGSTAVAQMLSTLLPQLQQRTRMIRERAAGQCKKMVDLWTFGPRPHTKDEEEARKNQALKERMQILARNRAELLEMAHLPMENFDWNRLKIALLADQSQTPWKETTPGANHLPTLTAERLELSTVAALLAETLQREAFLLHPQGGLFGGGDPFSRKSEALATQLSALMQGRDMSFPAFHPNQGHGSFATARVRIWASLPPARLGAVLAAPESGWNAVLQNCLLWTRTPLENSAPATSSADINTAHQVYENLLHQLIEERCQQDHQNQARVFIDGQNMTLFLKMKNQLLSSLDDTSPQNRPYLVQFHDLLERILWLLCLFRTRDHPSGGMVLAYNVALHGMRMHAQALKQARQTAAEEELKSRQDAILRVLKKRGPLTFRDIQRSSNNQRKSDLVPGLEQLLARGEILYDASHRYHLTHPRTTAILSS